MARYEPIVEQLKSILDSNEEMKRDLNSSLKKAVALAQKDNKQPNKQHLNEALYHAIDKELEGYGWPTTVEDYYIYLDHYVKIIPNERKGTHHAWSSDGTKNGYNQKVYDLLCQFYFLVDQENEEKKTMQNYPEFSKWLINFATSWGTFLNTEASLTDKTLKSFEEDVNEDGESMYNFPLYSDHKEKWKTFNDFFYREFNHVDKRTGRSSLRPISEPDNNKNIVSPADCTFKAYYKIEEGNIRAPKNTRIKHTHTLGTVEQLLNFSEFSHNFHNGTFIHYFLNPFDYHRFHTPVKGKILEIINASGKVFLNVEMTKDGQFNAPDGADNRYEFNQSRGIVIMEGGPDVGKIAIIPIGMAQVSGVDMYTELQGENVEKGQEFGKFKFGGSDIIMLFEKSYKDLYMFTKDPSHKPIHFQYGQTAVYCS